MTNFTIGAFDNNGESIMTAHTTKLSDATKIAELFPNSEITDFHTGEIILTRRNGATI